MLLKARAMLILSLMNFVSPRLFAAETCAATSGCNGSNLCENPTDTSAKGAWNVGAKTVRVKNLNVEVWYPADASNSLAAGPKNYDLRQWLPTGEQKKIPDAEVPAQVCDCYADLSIDKTHGPYPVILFAHGTAAFRTQSLTLMTHLASRGFIVLAADHPGLYLGDLLQFKLGAKVTADLQSILASLRSQDPALAFIQDSVDLEHIGMIGHSAGGSAIAAEAAASGVAFLAPMAAGGTKAGSTLKGSLILGALDDKVVAFNRQQSGFEQSPAPKRLVGISNAGHLAFSDLCALKNAKGEDPVAVAQKYRINNSGFATRLWDGCAKGQLDPVLARSIVNYSVAAGAEEALQCADRTESFKAFPGLYKDLGAFKEAL